MFFLTTVFFDCCQVKFLCGCGRTSVDFRFVEKEAELFISVVIFALFTGRIETLFPGQSDLFRESFDLHGEFSVNLFEALVFRFGDRHGIVAHGVSPLAFVSNTISLSRSITAVKARYFNAFKASQLPKTI